MKKLKNWRSKRQMSETLFVGSVLSIIGGYFDTYTYMTRGGVFANAQTGNIVLLGLNIADGNFVKALLYLIPIFAFILGVIVAEFIHKISTSKYFHWRQTIILIELIAIVIVSFMPSNNTTSYVYDMAANVLISFVCSLQVQSFRKIHGIVCATTMCTGNLRSASEALVRYGRTHDKTALKAALKFTVINLFFVVGIIISSFITQIFNEKSIIFCGFGLVLVLVLMFIKPIEE